MSQIHWTQKARQEQIEQLSKLIILKGGWGKITAEVGEVPFAYFACKSLGCTLAKYQEYLAVILRGII